MEDLWSQYHYQRVLNVVTRNIQQVAGLAGRWIPVQAMWRGHWDRCTVQLSVTCARSKARQRRVPNDARRVLRLALSLHTVRLDYELADGMYRKANTL